MLKLLKYCLWIIVILVLTIGFDQLMVRLPMTAPGLKQTQIFYIDFRARILKLSGRKVQPEEDMIEKVIEKSSKVESKTSTKPIRYLYVDDQGTLQFADSLQQVPIKYRQKAQPLAE